MTMVGGEGDKGSGGRKSGKRWVIGHSTSETSTKKALVRLTRGPLVDLAKGFANEWRRGLERGP